MTIRFLNSGQSSVNVSYSPPSPQILRPYFSCIFTKWLWISRIDLPKWRSVRPSEATYMKWNLLKKSYRNRCRSRARTLLKKTTKFIPLWLSHQFDNQSFLAIIQPDLVAINNRAVWDWDGNTCSNAYECVNAFMELKELKINAYTFSHRTRW